MKKTTHRVCGLLCLIAVVVTTALLCIPAAALAKDASSPPDTAQSQGNALIDGFAGYHPPGPRQDPPQPKGKGGGQPPGPAQQAPQGPAAAPSHPSQIAPTAAQALGQIVQCESSGNYRAVNPASGAGGAYQIMPSTWRQFGGTGLPQDAPSAEQDQIAQRIYQAQGPSPWVCGRKLKLPGGQSTAPAPPQAKAPAPPAPVQGEGLDVAEGNGDINWQAVRQSGHGWAIVKATEGTSSNDKMFGRGRVEAMRAAGVTPGYYHFARPQPGHTGAQEADHFLQVVRAAGGLESGDIAPVLDVEVTKLDPQQTFEFVRSFVDEVRQQTGLETVIYTYPYFWRDQVASQGNLGSTLWIATYGSHPLVPASWQSEGMWQYSSSGHVNGVAGEVDLDRALGTVPVVGHDAFKAPIPATTPEPAKAPASAAARTAVGKPAASTWTLDLGALLAMLFALCVCAPLARLSARQRNAYISALADDIVALPVYVLQAVGTGIANACEAFAGALVNQIAKVAALPVYALRATETGIANTYEAFAQEAKHQTRLVGFSLSELTGVARLGQTAPRIRRRRGSCVKTGPVRARRVCNARALTPVRRRRTAPQRVCLALIALPGVLRRAGPLGRRRLLRWCLGPARVRTQGVPQDAAPRRGPAARGPSTADKAPAPKRMRAAEAQRRKRGPPAADALVQTTPNEEGLAR